MEQPINPVPSQECQFDADLRILIQKYTNDGLLSAGEVVAVMEFVKHSVIHEAERAAAIH
jgi:hypothetical protein